MSWMDFKTAQAMKAQKMNEEARRQKLGSVQKGTSATSHIGVDSMSVSKALGMESNVRMCHNTDCHSNACLPCHAIALQVHPRKQQKASVVFRKARARSQRSVPMQWAFEQQWVWLLE
jgi:hypothetical protein